VGNVILGRNYAAKVMHGRSELRGYMNNELDILNVLNHRKLIRLQDCFEAKDQLVLILELYPFISYKNNWDVLTIPP